ncbi:PKD domain-containing protein [Micromonospora sp. NPDC049836]|uniref:PKD domain-containing protein n=1 Tax=Micromonospora sp. NPDC049836 TaxID=3364274 RepID=UPI00379DBEA1
MRRTSLAALTAAAVTGGLLLPTTAARADEPTVRYVRQFSTACSDTGPGTLAQPFCSIAPAAAIVGPGQTVEVGPGTYRERVAVTRSGTPDQPIVFRSDSTNSNALLTGPAAGITIDGQHDIMIQRFHTVDVSEAPAVDLRNSAGITIEGGNFDMADGFAAPAIRLAGVTHSTIARTRVNGQKLATGVAMDAATNGVSLTDMAIGSDTLYSSVDHSVGIRVAGAGNMIRNSFLYGFTGSAIAVEAGASDTLVVNNHIRSGAGHGIHNHSATGTAITNNTVLDRCLDGIRVDGTSADVSVQNNQLFTNGPFGQPGCEPGVASGVEIGVHGDAVSDTVIDYNYADHSSSGSQTIYAWNGVQMSLPAFRAASGQAAHDLESQDPKAATDSANSAAPGFPSTDLYGTARADDPAVPNTGAGPITYADRGATETIRSPVVRFETALDLGDSSITVDASASEPGMSPIASYRFNFGDGVYWITQDSPVATHRYAAPGLYIVAVQVIGTDGGKGAGERQVTMLHRIGTVGLLALSNRRYVAPLLPSTALRADHAALQTSDRLDLADAGNGQIALYSPAAKRYIARDITGLLGTTSTDVSVFESFTLVRNTDGTVSLRTVNGYVSTGSQGAAFLSVAATAIGTTEKFYRVNVADANRSLRALSNKLYVTADSAGSKPLTASRTSAGLTERFDLVDLGNGQVALFAGSNNRFVSADGAGAKPLIAIRATVGSWERFTIVRNTDGTVSIKAGANNRYVTALRTNPLIASGSTTGTQQRFQLR